MAACFFTSRHLGNSAVFALLVFPAAGEVSTNSMPGQNWNWHVQNTDIVQGHQAFSAKYTNPGFNSLPPGGETPRRSRWI